MQDFENDIVIGFGGTGLAADGAPPNPPLGAPNRGRSRELDALAAYVESLRDAPPSPYRALDGSETESARRGGAVFVRAGCADCHVPPLFTDSTLTMPFVLHDVGTIGLGSGSRLGGPLTGIDTPSLLGVWTSAPYFHDGSAATLEEAVLERNLDDRHGITSALRDDERADLVEFLRELDRPEAAAVTPATCGCRIAGRPRLSAGWVAGAVVLVVLSRRRRR